jgi:hypothetical protein
LSLPTARKTSLRSSIRKNEGTIEMRKVKGKKRLQKRRRIPLLSIKRESISSPSRPTMKTGACYA